LEFFRKLDGVQVLPHTFGTMEETKAEMLRVLYPRQVER